MCFDPMQCGIRKNSIKLVFKWKRGRIGNPGIQAQCLRGGNHFPRVIHGSNDRAGIGQFLRENTVTAADIKDSLARFG
jgi:hypothetical protein